MKKSMVTLLVGISMAALLSGGCANKEAAKKEEAVVPTASTAKAEPAKTVEQTTPVEQAKPAEQVQPSLGEAVTPTDSKSAAEAKFETVYFDFDKSDLRQDARDVLSKNAEIILKSLPGAKIQIAGNCDELGSAEYNMALGERRAKSAQNYLITLGVKAENLSIISYGKEKPAVIGNDEAARAKNRRDEFVVIK